MFWLCVVIITIKAPPTPAHIASHSQCRHSFAHEASQCECVCMAPCALQGTLWGSGAARGISAIRYTPEPILFSSRAAPRRAGNLCHVQASHRFDNCRSRACLGERLGRSRFQTGKPITIALARLQPVQEHTACAYNVVLQILTRT
jgi:hypothetical protein